MKNSIILFATLFIINFVNGQETVKNYYNYGIGNIKDTGQLNKDGFPIGEWKYYLENGTLDYIINWDINLSKSFYTTGELKEKGTFIPDTGSHIGEWIAYYKNGKIKSIMMFDENGLKNGECKTYFENGKVESVEIYKKGEKQD